MGPSTPRAGYWSAQVHNVSFGSASGSDYPQLAIDSNYTDARFDLASVEAAIREWESAVNRHVLAERPQDTKARQHLGEVLFLGAMTSPRPAITPTRLCDTAKRLFCVHPMPRCGSISVQRSPRWGGSKKRRGIRAGAANLSAVAARTAGPEGDSGARSSLIRLD
jgi:hypothetical protein